MTSAVYKAPLVRPVVNQKNSVLLQLAIVHLIFSLRWLNTHAGNWPVANYLSTPSCFFNYRYSIMIFASSLWHCSFSYESSLFLHKIVMLAVHARNTTSNTITVTIYNCMKIIVDDQFITRYIKNQRFKNYK